MVRMLVWDMEFENGVFYLVYPPDVIIDLLLFELCILSCLLFQFHREAGQEVW